MEYFEHTRTSDGRSIFRIRKEQREQRRKRRERSYKRFKRRQYWKRHSDKLMLLVFLALFGIAFVALVITQ